MPAPRRRGLQDRVGYVVIGRDNMQDEEPAAALGVESHTETVDRILRRSYTRRQMPTPTNTGYDSDDEEESTTTTKRPFISPTATPSGPLAITKTPTQPTNGALADNDPTQTNIVSLQPPPPKPHNDRDGPISQTTEHLLIAAGSIGATIVIVMIILALYTMRKRGLTLTDVIRNGKNTVKRRRGPPPPPKYGMDSKQIYDNNYMYAGKDVCPPRTAAVNSRSGSLSTQTPIQPLGRSDSFNLSGLERKDSGNRSFLLDDAPSRQNSYRRDDSTTPSSPVLPIQTMRRSASTGNTRSLDGDEELRCFDPPRQRISPPVPPTFRQFLSNRPCISQRPGLGGAMMSRFSWTNSNAPQTPHDLSRDTVNQPIAGRDSFMTQRSSVPRFRTIDSWVNQQSNRVEEQKLKQQFRMTQSSTSSGEGDYDQVPEMPAVSKNSKESSSLPGSDIRHQRQDTRTTIETAPIFKQHPGTEVRFSVRSIVPSEVLDMGRKNAAL